MGLRSRLSALFRKQDLHNVLEEELEFHLAMRAQLNEAKGMSRDDAHREARVRFGNAGLWRERMYAIDGWILPHTVVQDLRYGFRMLTRNPGFTFVAVLALAMGIGINAAFFVAYKALHARHVDAKDSSRMVDLAQIRQGDYHDLLFSYPDYQVYRDQMHSFSGMVATSHEYESVTLTGAGGTASQRNAATGSLLGRAGMIPASAISSNSELTSIFMVSEDYFSVLGVRAIRGRSFDELNAKELAASPTVMISENYWQRRFSGDPAIVGRVVRLNGHAFTILGIAPHDFVGTGFGVPNFWYPLSLDSLVHPEDQSLHDRESRICRLTGRLAPGISMSEAQAEMTVVSESVRKLHDPQSELFKAVPAQIYPGSPFPGKFPAPFRFALILVILAAGMVLVIACANVASLQLARSASRQNELGMRLSLGASRMRLIRQLLTESALLGLLAGVVAFLLTWAILSVGATVAKDALPVEMGVYIVDVTPDFQVFAYVLGISLLAGILFGLMPALESSRSALSSALKANAGSSPNRGSRLRGLLIGGQVAVSLVLLIAGSMLIRSSVRALEMDTGYDSKHVVDLSLQFPQGATYSVERKAAVVRELRVRLSSLPGVSAVTSARAPDDGNFRTALISLNADAPSAHNTQATLFYTYVQPNYFETLGIPLLSGHTQQAQGGQPEPSVILSESAAKRLWPGKDPIGRTFRAGTDGQYHDKGELVPDGPTYRVIGISRNTRGVTIGGRDSEQVYFPMPQDRQQDYTVLIRANSGIMQVTRAVVAKAVSVDPDLMVSVSTLDEMLRQVPVFTAASFSAAIASTIGFFGLLLALMGIYGTVSYLVVLRTREVGIRIALGARKGAILGLMLRESTRPVVAGLLAGLVFAAGVAHLLRGVLYGLGTVDAISFGGVSFLFLGIALLAVYLPSRRAMRVDPMVALRYE